MRCLWISLVAAFAVSVNIAHADDDLLFREQIAPILEKRCVSCHSAKVAKGGLSLDSRAALFKGGDGGPPVEPGRPDESLLIEKIQGTKPEMPKSGDPLVKPEVDVLRRWITEGARWPEGLTLVDRKFDGETWWAFRPLTHPPLPKISDAGWCRNSLDMFILQGLRSAGMTPSAEADRRTLIRRLSFDLTGLPPTPEEVAAFEADASPDAYEKQVDRLLASPAYGERWARHWLDVVHYGDTHGYDKDKRRDHAWPYRDYVIGSFNQDLPYARFLKEQVAGDILFPDDPRSTIATGFLAAGPWDFVGNVELREGTVDKEKTRLIDRDDMLSNVVTTFQSLTIGCARCHDHKFDPIPQRDYYRLQAVFSGIDRGDRPYSPSDRPARQAEFAKRKANLNARLTKIDREIDALTSLGLKQINERITLIVDQLTALPPSSRALPPSSPTNGFHSSIFDKPDSSAWVQVDLGRSYPLDEVRLIPARPVDFPDTPGFGFPRRYRVEVSDDPSFKQDATLVESDEIADAERVADEPLVIPIGGRSARYVRVSAARLWKRSGDYVFALAELEAISQRVNRAEGSKVASSGSIEAGRWSTKHLVDGFDSRSKRPDATGPSVARRSELLRDLRRFQRDRRAKIGAATPIALRSKRDGIRADLIVLDASEATSIQGPLVYAVRPIPPRPIRVLARGDVEKPGEVVGPGTLSCLKELPSIFPESAEEGTRRAALGEWLARLDNPLTWRSIVNRVWQYHVGKGLVDTPGDFGRNGSKPSHPELLDWLAAEFRDGGGSLKSLHRLIVLSSFYRQSSADVPRFSKLDGDNRKLWRMNRRRLEAEAVRDSVLAVVGTLDCRMQGPAFEPFRFKDDHSPIYDHNAIDRVLAPENRRRSVYRFTVRSVPHPFLECLDAADPNIATPTRSTTVTPLQALALWNDPFILDQAEAFARRVGSPGGSTEASVDRAVRLAFGRPPRPDEARALAKLARSRGLASVCRLLLNTNEFLFVD